MSKIGYARGQKEGIKGKTEVQLKFGILRQMFAAYLAVILLILFFAILNYKCPTLFARFLRDEVGVVAFVCFITIQGVFEIENDLTVAKYPFQFYFKVAIYVLDICVIINARVKPIIVIYSCLFALIQLYYLLHSLQNRYLGPNSDPKSQRVNNYQSI